MVMKEGGRGEDMAEGNDIEDQEDRVCNGWTHSCLRGKW